MFENRLTGQLTSVAGAILFALSMHAQASLGDFPLSVFLWVLAVTIPLSLQMERMVDPLFQPQIAFDRNNQDPMFLNGRFMVGILSTSLVYTTLSVHELALTFWSY